MTQAQQIAPADMAVFLARLDALEAEISEMRAPFLSGPDKRQCLNEGMIDGAFGNMRRNISTIRTNAMAFQSLLVLREAEARRRVAAE
ncbi:MAG: hypothetical protein KAH44_18155 [Oricola sp.]|jgi:hypothetical protein|nr:hypothetical protein [Oricola sp.]